MKKMIEFDPKYRPQVESGEFSVVTRDGRKVNIVKWDGGMKNYPIESVVNFMTRHHAANGSLVLGMETDADLFIVPNIERYEVSGFVMRDCDGDLAFSKSMFDHNAVAVDYGADGFLPKEMLKDLKFGDEQIEVEVEVIVKRKIKGNGN